MVSWKMLYGNTKHISSAHLFFHYIDAAIILGNVLKIFSCYEV